MRGQAVDAASIEVDLPVIWTFDSGDEIEEGGLAGAVGADEAGYAAAGDREGAVTYRLDAAEVSGDRRDAQKRIGG